MGSKYTSNNLPIFKLKKLINKQAENLTYIVFIRNLSIQFFKADANT